MLPTPPAPHPGLTQRLVLDTNVWLDWLVFDDPGVASIRTAVTRGSAMVYLSEACAAELARVLAYPLARFTLDTTQQAAALARCRALACGPANFSDAHDIAVLPRCADPDDQKFLQLARDCRADVLISKDRALLAMAQRRVRALPFRIITPEQFELHARRAAGVG